MVRQRRDDHTGRKGKMEMGELANLALGSDVPKACSAINTLVRSIIRTPRNQMC